MDIVEAKDEIWKKFKDEKNFAGCAIGEKNGTQFISVYLESNDKFLKSKIPSVFQNYQVIVQVTGKFSMH